MRADLRTLEQIDWYLTGKMSAAEASAFKTKIAANPELQSLVSNQELLIQTVNRKAMMAELNSIAGVAGAAGGGAAGWGITQWAITAFVAVGATVGSYFIYNNFNSETKQEIIVDNQKDSEDVIIENNLDTGDFISFDLTEATDEYEKEVNDYPIFKDEIDDRKNTSEIQIYSNKTVSIINKNPLKNDNIQKDKVKDDNNLKNENHVLTIKPDKKRKAIFPGGLLKMKSFISKNLMYPRTPKDKGLQGTVKVYFIVSAEGNISHVESDCFIMKDKTGKPLSSGKMIANVKSQKYFEKNAERLFRMSSPWSPATDSQGNPVLSGQTWYVNFDYYGQSSAYQLENIAPKVSTCNINSEADWQNVNVLTMKVKNQPKDFKLIGESMINTASTISNVQDLTDDEYIEICRTAAKYKACTVYIDVNNFWGTGDGNLYYSFGSFVE